MSEGTFKNGELMDSLFLGIKMTKEFEETYKDGELISGKYWNEDGSVK